MPARLSSIGPPRKTAPQPQDFRATDGCIASARGCQFPDGKKEGGDAGPGTQTRMSSRLPVIGVLGANHGHVGLETAGGLDHGHRLPDGVHVARLHHGPAGIGNIDRIPARPEIGAQAPRGVVPAHRPDLHALAVGGGFQGDALRLVAVGIAIGHVVGRHVHGHGQGAKGGLGGGNGIGHGRPLPGCTATSYSNNAAVPGAQAPKPMSPNRYSRAGRSFPGPRRARRATRLVGNARPW